MKTCECGCGSDVVTGRRFVTGHNSKMGRRKKYIAHKCRHCGVDFETPPSETTRSFCSPACRDDYRRVNNGEKHPSFYRVAVDCGECGSQIMVMANKSSGTCYCSPECGRKGKSEKGKSRFKFGSAGRGRRLALERDQNKCRLCGFDLCVNVHHITPKSETQCHEPCNLITLCPNHHAMAHSGSLSAEYLYKSINSIMVKL